MTDLDRDLERAGPDPYEDLGHWVRLARLDRGLSRRQLADRADISVPYVAKIENGERRPQAPVVRRLADALEVAPSVLLQTQPLGKTVTGAQSRTWNRVQGAPPASSAPPAPPAPDSESHVDRAALLSEAMALLANSDMSTLQAVVATLRQSTGR